MYLQWIKCQGDVWGKLNTVNLGHKHFDSMSGIYIIWHGGSTPATVRVGQGNIRERLAQHRKDSEVQKYEPEGLYVTWASVSNQFCDGVESYLAWKLQPKVGKRYPNPVTGQIIVNLPW